MVNYDVGGVVISITSGRITSHARLAASLPTVHLQPAAAHHSNSLLSYNHYSYLAQDTTCGTQTITPPHHSDMNVLQPSEERGYLSIGDHGLYVQFCGHIFH